MSRSGLAVSIAVSLSITGYGDSDDEIIHSDNVAASKLRDNSIGRLFGALSESPGLSQGGGTFILEYGLASGRA